jgi:hypothetical protein
MPHAKYTLSEIEKTSFCEWLKCVKFPDGYTSNISRCVNTKEGKISGMKIHDCHVLLQRLLQVVDQSQGDSKDDNVEWVFFFFYWKPNIKINW